ncbi:uncharacterized protein PAC_08671 [Phialocephala subalpina]|uniref:NACHT domain-containing protein n=1 Tax=Phialocephala subalpina TaxID=576137 RepID=A0A1L7X184_9HELO|nr:uncharacterized protein PAC_08671 [Phialocephala subalpina]
MSSPAEPPASILPSAWERAHSQFSQDLTPAELHIYQTASIETITNDMKVADRSFKSSRSKQMLDKISPFVDTIHRYGSALDVLANTYPLIMAPLWGGIRVILCLAHQCGSYFKNVANMISQIDEHLPRFGIYEKLFIGHERVVAAVTAAFLDVLYFLFKFIWRTFEEDFDVGTFRKHNEKILQEVDLADKIEAQRHWKANNLARIEVQSKSAEDRQWHTDRAHAQFLTSLHICDYELQKDMVPKHAPRTCEWLFKDQSFWRWWQGHTNLLLITLGPAMGKSVLARTVVDFFRSNEVVHIPENTYERTVCYFFFKGEDDSRRDARSAVSALLHQLLHEHPELLEYAFKVSKAVVDTPSYTSLWDLFRKLLRSDLPFQIVWVIDGLDECEISRARLIESLALILQGSLERSRLKVIITSRPLSSICDIMQDTRPSSKYFIRLGENDAEQQQIRKEVEFFIISRVQKFGELRRKRIGIDDDASDLLRGWILSKGNRNYLWASFVFEELDKSASLSRADLADILETIPTSCSEFYEKILSKCSNPGKTRILLHAVLGASRPLTMTEMNYVLSLRPDQSSVEEVDLIPENKFAITIQELCGFFVNVVDGRIYLIHQTAKEYLLQQSIHGSGSFPGIWKHALASKASHEMLARACLQYLQFKTFEKPPSVEDDFLRRNILFDRHGWWREDYPVSIDAIDAYLKEHSFLEYAACNWFDHLEKCKLARDDDLIAKALQLCNVQSKAWTTWFTVFIRKWERNTAIPPFKSTLHFVSWFGFTEGVRTSLRQEEYSVDEKLLAVTHALLRGHRNITKLFQDLDFPRRSRARRLREIEQVLEQVEEAFGGSSSELQELIDEPMKQLREYRELLVEQIELAADTRDFSRLKIS